MNTLAAVDKYSRRNVQNFQQQLQRHYLKNNRFCLQFLLLSQIYIKFRTFFFKKDESPGLSISQIIDSEIGGYLNV